MSVWKSIKAAVSRGEEPHVLLGKPYVEPKKTGRPKTERPVDFTPPIDGRKARSPYLRAKKARCWNPHCRKQLRNRYVCNETCREAAVNYFETALALLRPETEQPPKEVPDVQDYESIRAEELAKLTREAGLHSASNGKSSVGKW